MASRGSKAEMMDGRIISARDVTKVYARGGGFDGAEMGMLGIVATTASSSSTNPSGNTR